MEFTSIKPPTPLTPTATEIEDSAACDNTASFLENDSTHSVIPINSMALDKRQITKKPSEQMLQWETLRHLGTGGNLTSLSFLHCEELQKHCKCFDWHVLPKLSIDQISYFIKKQPGLIKYVPKEKITSEMCADILKKEFYLIKYLPTEKITAEMRVNIFTNKGKDDFFYLFPKELITLEQVEHILNYKSDLLNLENIPENILNDKEIQYKILKKLHMQSSMLSTDILKDNVESVQKVCLRYTSTIKEFDALNIGLINQNLINQLAESKTINLNNIPIKFITKEILLKNLQTDNMPSYDTINQLYPKFKTEIQEFATKYYKNKNELMKYLPYGFLSATDILSITDTDRLIARITLPDNIKNDSILLLQLIKKQQRIIKTLEPEYFNSQICDYFIKNAGFEYIKYIPLKYYTSENTIRMCIRIKDIPDNIPKEFITDAWKNKLIKSYLKRGIFSIKILEYYFTSCLQNDDLFNRLFDDTLHFCAKYSSGVFEVLTSTKIPSEFKNKLYHHIIEGNFNLPKSTPNKLYSKECPLDYALPGYYLYELISECYTLDPKYAITLPEEAKAQQKFTEEFIKNNTNLVKSKIDIPATSLAKGGRTIQVNTENNQALYYKFRRCGEKLEDFMNEVARLEFLNTTVEGKNFLKEMESDVPTDVKIFCVSKNDLDKFLAKLSDPVHVYTTGKGEKQVDVISFTNSENYLDYAHQLDKNNFKQPYARGKEGIKKALHDYAKNLKNGFMYDSVMVAFHFEDRVWCAIQNGVSNTHFYDTIHPLYKEISMAMAGKFNYWDSDATAKSDFGFTGGRDFGDHVYYGDIKQILKLDTSTDSTSNKNKQFMQAQQYLSIAIITCNLLVSAKLLHSRLHKFSADYHYTNKETHNRNKIDIAEQFSKFLEGFTGSNRTNLWDFMGISYEDYDKWLDRASFEDLYWCAEQPKIEADSLSLPFDISKHPTFDINDCFTQHLMQHKKLPEEYFDAPTIIKYAKLKIPDDFMSAEGKASLGMRNSSFPLVSYMRGVYLFTTKIIQCIKEQNKLRNLKRNRATH